MAYRTTREQFESLAEKALEKLPKEFMDRLKNITIQVEDYPSREEARSVGTLRRQACTIIGVWFPLLRR